MQRQIFVDTETTGLKPQLGHRIIEVGCLEMVGRRLTGNSFHYYINPERDIDQGAMAVHGITLESLKDKPLFAEIAEKLIEYLQDAELIIHNAPFDVGFLEHEFRKIKSKFKLKQSCSITDTLAMARRKHPGQRNSLDALCQRYRIDNSNRELHGALLDAELLAKVYLRMTGGQTQLFEEEQTQHTVRKTEQEQQHHAAKRKPLPILPMDAEDQKAHAEFLKKMQKEGACLWDDSK